MSQAMSLMPALNGYGTLKEESSAGASDAVDTAAETFVTDGLAKVLKINNICDNDHLYDCGLASNIVKLDGGSLALPKTIKELNSFWQNGIAFGGSSTFSMLDTKAVAFETTNGESILTFYNPNCKMRFVSLNSGDTQMSQENLCVNFIYDLNGSKGPNTVGKDIGAISVMYPADILVVAPVPALRKLSQDYAQTDAARACTEFDSEYRLPNIEELISLFINQKLYGSSLSNNGLWSSTLVTSTKALAIGQGSGAIYTYGRNGARGVRCVKRN